ncbi:30S ribosomal protein S5 [bacterium (Candidatus Blackallbacteria) CG17_big_fil_post_rev_8_21_14_2_50_48_46]|uniref:Small ribosomal subunit protein uS5 n=1 Tax=bacterium (Candidatus Blackallbacteria) CG17_big_fil_post_rev_8_21_14_2_50_48_46 TaxID=2014261 RepID=A0A2M7G122_9BACT|nr:MAG: 30S ribosomal protein S5 [bacterium (Candidatus Blackallbacteria) CG18_big_fil_WC_8_21_14_2_50_49_26]PIW15408.1 MAG: 30S ribosomal protein S5 [bacterium (Candidatus Blackallbacteria) CG17_big_fil_post_rev_8_21_14_2_50_48_46]PIW49731.1 MAG: 30S ribosomal protein S5 [bacterium (Candidatus Blackallbacteria) CG13_big_fil_rev_8_21_14_2_50_49_14]
MVKKQNETDSQWTEKVVQVRRVTKVVKGGKRLSFRVITIVGDGEGQVGVGVGKSSDVVGAIQKGMSDARKNLIQVPIVNTTIPHPVNARFGSASVLVKPARQGTGVIAGGAVRIVLEAAGIKNATAKCLGSKSPLNNARAAIEGLKELRTIEQISASRGLSAKEIVSGRPV